VQKVGLVRRSVSAVSLAGLTGRVYHPTLANPSFELPSWFRRTGQWRITRTAGS